MESYFIPAGPKNLGSLFPTLDWDDVMTYYLVVKDASGTELATSPLYKMNCCCPEGYVRIEFMNDDGTKDCINFGKPQITQTTQSTVYQKPKAPNSIAKTDYGLRRFNVVANDVYECTTTCYDEAAMEWMGELFRSAIAYMYHPPHQGQQEYYVPINIIDGDFVSQKNLDEWYYLVTIKFNLENIYSSIRT